MSLSGLGFDSGCHEWEVEIKARPCCGYSGIAISADTCNSSYSSHFVDKDTCMGFSNFSGNRNLTYDPGAKCRIKLDIDEGPTLSQHSLTQTIAQLYI